MKNQEILRGIS